MRTSAGHCVGGGGAQCTYSVDGRLILDGMNAGTIDWSCPAEHPIRHILDDVLEFIAKVIAARGEADAEPVRQYLDRHATPLRAARQLEARAASRDPLAGARAERAGSIGPRALPDVREGPPGPSTGAPPPPPLPDVREGPQLAVAWTPTASLPSTLGAEAGWQAPVLAILGRVTVRDRSGGDPWSVGALIRIFPGYLHQPGRLPLAPEPFVDVGFELGPDGEPARDAGVGLDSWFVPWFGLGVRHDLAASSTELMIRFAFPDVAP